MLRILIFFVFVFTVAFGAVWLADNPGNVTIDFQSYRVDTSFAAIIAFISGLVLLTGGLVWLVGYMRRELPVIGTNSAVKRQSRGLKLLNQSLVALSAGDHKLAGRLVAQAEAILPPQPMVHLIAAETASRGGDYDSAKKRYKALEESDDGRLLGLRGLVNEARRIGHSNEALRLARIAFDENRKSPWVLKTLFALEVDAGNWSEAEAALDKVAKEGLLDKDLVTRHRGALIYAVAMEASLKGANSEAQKGFKKALSLRPEFAPAAVGLANLEVKNGNARKAEKIILDAWGVAPRPSLLTQYKSLDAHENAQDWIKRAQKLADRRPESDQSTLIVANALYEADDFAGAQAKLGETTTGKRPKEIIQLALKVAHALGDSPDALESELANAPAGDAWHCNDCGYAEPVWSILCKSCGGFDTLFWRSDDGQRRGQRADDTSTIAILAAEETAPTAISYEQ